MQYSKKKGVKASGSDVSEEGESESGEEEGTQPGTFLMEELKYLLG